MPRYEYRCRSCDTVFELRRAMADAGAPARCPEGHTDTVKLLSAFASVGAATRSGAEAPRPCGGACVCHPG